MNAMVSNLQHHYMVIVMSTSSLSFACNVYVVEIGSRLLKKMKVGAGKTSEETER